MISKVVVFHCPECDSTNVVKNGKNSAGSQQFLCKECRKSAVMYPQNQRSQEEKEQILSAYHERPSMRGIARMFHISRDSLKKLLTGGKKVSEQPTVKESLLPAESEDVLELDEIWSFVFIKTDKYWLWTAIILSLVGSLLSTTWLLPIIMYFEPLPKYLSCKAQSFGRPFAPTTRVTRRPNASCFKSYSDNFP